MSLKAIHLVFISASTLLAMGFSGWSLSNFFAPEGGVKLDLALGLGSALSAVGLMVYGVYFLKKLKNVSFL